LFAYEGNTHPEATTGDLAKEKLQSELILPAKPPLDRGPQRDWRLDGAAGYSLSHQGVKRLVVKRIGSPMTRPHPYGVGSANAVVAVRGCTLNRPALSNCRERQVRRRRDHDAAGAHLLACCSPSLPSRPAFDLVSVQWMLEWYAPGSHATHGIASFGLLRPRRLVPQQH
jgi:hypothetical protein